MVSKLALARCWQFVFTPFPYESLTTKGFAKGIEVSDESHGELIQSLLVPSPTRSPISLDFIEIQDEGSFLKNQSENQKLKSEKGRELLRPGLSFFGQNKQSFSVGSIPIEIQSDKAMSASLLMHENGIQNLFGIYLGLNTLEAKEWESFLGIPNDTVGWVLGDGVKIIKGMPGDGIFERMESRKDFPFWAVVLECESFNKLEKFDFEFKSENLLEWQGNKILQIKEHLTNWDILIKEKP